jgi:hypothetical protein
MILIKVNNTLLIFLLLYFNIMYCTSPQWISVVTNFYCLKGFYDYFMVLIIKFIAYSHKLL